MTTARKDAAKAASSHGVTHGHDSRVDELSEERATRHEQPIPPWMRPSSLDAPPPRPGMVQRWIRHLIRGDADPRNVSMRTREGWRPRPADSVPEDWKATLGLVENDKGVLIVDDLMLCEMPREIYEGRAKHYDEQTRLQAEGVRQELERSQVRGHPIHKTFESSVSHPARKVRVADDE